MATAHVEGRHAAAMMAGIGDYLGAKSAPKHASLLAELTLRRCCRRGRGCRSISAVLLSLCSRVKRRAIVPAVNAGSLNRKVSCLKACRDQLVGPGTLLFDRVCGERAPAPLQMGFSRDPGNLEVVGALPANSSLQALVGPDAAMPLLPPFAGRTNDLSNGLIWPKDG